MLQAPSQPTSMTNRFPSLDTVNRNITAGPTRDAAANLNQDPGAWWKSKEGIGFAGQAMTAGANILGSQSAAAQAQREYEDQQRQLQARAELMAMFAPQMARNVGADIGSYTFPYRR